MGEQVEQGLGETPVQMAEKVPQKPRKQRSQSDKIGRERYNQQLLKRALVVLEDLRAEMRWNRRALIAAGYGRIDEPTIQQVLIDQVDGLILDKVKSVGVVGVFPKDVAEFVNSQGAYGLRYYDVSRRMVRMNKRLHFETGEYLFEKRGHKWALTSVGFEAVGK